MGFIQNLFTSRDNNANASSYVGQQDRIWWDPVTNGFYYSDGNTPGGVAIAGGGSGGGVTQSSSPPADPTSNTLWWDEVSGRLYIWYTDGSGSQWVDAAPAGIPAGNVTLTGILGAPQQTKLANDIGNVGQICWDTDYIYVCTSTNTWKRSPLTGGY